jgi:hypothetical protein
MYSIFRKSYLHGQKLIIVREKEVEPENNIRKWSYLNQLEYELHYCYVDPNVFDTIRSIQVPTGETFIM